jgi:acid phosphatase
MRRLRAIRPRLLAALLTAVSATTVAGTAAAAMDRHATVPEARKVVLIVFENKSPAQVIGSGQAPSFDRLSQRYALLGNYRGVAHPSLPNYLALVSGSTHGVTSDCTSCRVRARNLADTLEAAGKTWKTYAEGLPGAGYTGSSSGRYAKKHNPLLYFEDVLSSRQRLRRIVPLTSFGPDLKAHELPDFSLVVPDLCHDMHDCSVATGDAWLHGFLGPLLASGELEGGVVFVVFDEGTGSLGGGGRVPALVIGPLVRRGSRANVSLDHYSLLRTIEDSWGLPRLGRSRTAIPITGIWK